MEFRLTIPSSAIFDQSVMQHLLDLDPVVQDYRAFFALLDWSLVDPCMAMWCWPSTPCSSMKLTSPIIDRSSGSQGSLRHLEVREAMEEYQAFQFPTEASGLFDM